MHKIRIARKPLHIPVPISKASYASQARRGPSQQFLQHRPTRRPPPSSPKRRAIPLRHPQSSSQPPEAKQSSVDAISTALHDVSVENNNLLSPVHIPEDPDSVLKESHPAANILANSSIVVTRQMELMNIMLGFEQANKYVIMDPHGNHIGYMAERDLGMGNMMKRQFFSTHRSFTTHVFDKQQKEVLRFHRPFSWISSRIGVYDPIDLTNPQTTSQDQTTTAPGALSTDINPSTAQASQLPLSEMRIIGEAQQQWAPLRRKYNLFQYRGSTTAADPSTPELTSGSLPLSNTKHLSPITDPSSTPGEYSQFAYIDERFLSWDFSLLSSSARLLGSVNRNFAGFGREIFTDTGVYALRMDAAGLAEEPKHWISQTGQGAGAVVEGNGKEEEAREEEKGKGMTLDQRAVMLATAVSVDFDYFSRHSGSGGMGGGFMPLWFPGMGGGGAAAEAGAGAEAGGAGGAVEEAGEGAVGGLGRTAGGATGEGAAIGAAEAGGYEAMQRGGAFGDDASPTAGQMEQGQFGSPPPGQQPGQVGQGEDVWGNQDYPWGENRGGGGEGGGSGGGDGDGDGIDVGDWF